MTIPLPALEIPLRRDSLSISESTARKYELQDPDVRLMILVRDDDAAAFEELMLRYQRRLITVLEHLVGRRDLAEDLAQDVFLRVYRARKSYKPGSRFSTWLFTIANNVASNARRNLARRREVQVTSSEGSASMSTNAMERLAQEASGLMPTRRLDHTETGEIVRLALDSLNERQRMAVLLSKFEDMGYQDIADTMGMSVQAIKSLLFRARANLKIALNPYLQEGLKPTTDPRSRMIRAAEETDPEE